MRIGIDARELCGRPTGVGRYLTGLLNEWTTDPFAKRHEFVLYAHRALELRLDMRRFSMREVAGAGGTWWEQYQLPRVAKADHLDVFFAPAYTAPLRLQCPVVVTIHDLSFVTHPEWFTMREGLRRRVLTRRSAARASAILTISQCSGREIVERLGVSETRVHVIPLGVNTLASAGECPETPAHTDRVLYVGSIFNRRNIPDLIRAFAALARRHPTAALELVGDNRTYPRQDIAGTIAREQLNGRVRWRQYIEDEELRTLYGGARAFAFLSDYEGLGLTPLEALAAGVPPLLVDTPIAREACGDAALYVRAGDVSAISLGLERLLFDMPTRQAVLSAAPAVLARYQWPRTARETLAVLEGVA